MVGDTRHGWKNLIIFRHIYNMGGKLSTQRERFVTPMFTN